jgi:hypothetical protein
MYLRALAGCPLRAPLSMMACKALTQENPTSGAAARRLPPVRFLWPLCRRPPRADQPANASGQSRGQPEKGVKGPARDNGRMSTGDRNPPAVHLLCKPVVTSFLGVLTWEGGGRTDVPVV